MTTIDLTLWKRSTSFGVVMLSSKAASDAIGGDSVTLPFTFAAVPAAPMAGLMPFLGVERFVSECRALTDFMGNAVRCFIVSAREGKLDRSKLKAALVGSAGLSETSGAEQSHGAHEGKFMKIFGSLWIRQGRSETKTMLLNTALDLALDFDNWLSPIQGRLKASHPSLNEQQLETLNQVCMEAIRFGQETALHLCATMDLPSVQSRFDQLFVGCYPWVNQENLERAYRHCIYLATKTARAG